MDVIIDHVRKQFGDRQVLTDASVRIASGERVCLFGASGCGKTTLLRIICGLEKPDVGRVEIPEGARLACHFQEDRLLPWRTVAENLTLVTGDAAASQAWLDKMQLSDAAGLYPDELSGGMQKRVGIARAIALNPEYLFCDEPNSGLDPETSIVIDQLISSLTKELGITTIMNTHDMNSILEIGDNIGFLHKGTILWEGDRHSILSSDCRQLTDFLCSNTLARNIIRPQGR